MSKHGLQLMDGNPDLAGRVHVAVLPDQKDYAADLQRRFGPMIVVGFDRAVPL